MKSCSCNPGVVVPNDEPMKHAPGCAWFDVDDFAPEETIEERVLTIIGMVALGGMALIPVAIVLRILGVV